MGESNRDEELINHWDGSTFGTTRVGKRTLTCLKATKPTQMGMCIGVESWENGYGASIGKMGVDMSMSMDIGHTRSILIWSIPT